MHTDLGVGTDLGAERCPGERLRAAPSSLKVSTVETLATRRHVDNAPFFYHIENMFKMTEDGKVIAYVVYTTYYSLKILHMYVYLL